MNVLNRRRNTTLARNKTSRPTRLSSLTKTRTKHNGNWNALCERYLCRWHSGTIARLVLNKYKQMAKILHNNYLIT